MAGFTFTRSGQYRWTFEAICKWCGGQFSAQRSDALTGGPNCRKAQSRFNKAMAGGAAYETARRGAQKRCGKWCASAPSHKAA